MTRAGSSLRPSLPAVVLGFGYGGLGIARSLGRLGVAVHGVDADPGAAGFTSRYCRGAHVWDVARASATDTLCFLDDLGRRLGRAVLIPTSDAAAVLVATHADELAPRFLFPKTPARLVRQLTDKREVFRLANEFGMPTPLTVFPRSRDDVEQFAAHATFPVVLKAINPTRLEQRTGHRMALVQSGAELLRRYLDWEERASPNLMLQEHIPGGDDSVWMFNGVFNEWSECVAAFTGRKLRQHPAAGGATSLGECRRNERVERLTIDFMWALGYRGVLDIGYRFDARDGSYKLLDPNPRIGATFRLFVDEQGLDVARVLYADLTRQPVWPGRAREGRKWLVEDRDLDTSLAHLRDGSLGVRAWLASFAGVEEAAWFARDDLRPFLKVAGRLLRQALRAARRRVALALRAVVRGALEPRPVS